MFFSVVTILLLSSNMHMLCFQRYLHTVSYIPRFVTSSHEREWEFLRCLHMSVCVSVRLHRPISLKSTFHISGSVLYIRYLWQWLVSSLTTVHCMLYVLPFFGYDVMFSYNGANGPESKTMLCFVQSYGTGRTSDDVIFGVVRQMALPVTKLQSTIKGLF